MLAARSLRQGSMLRYVQGGGAPSNPLWTAKRQQLLATWNALLSERHGWDEHWSELGRYITPRVPRFCVQDRNRGHKRHNNIYNDAATRAVRVMAAGLMAGASSRARKWFGLTTEDPQLAKYHPVQVWLEDVSDILQRRLEKGNSYTVLHSMYEQLSVYGSACSVVLGDDDKLIHHYPSPIGEFALAQDSQNKVCTVFRRYQMTVREVVDQFGLPNCSDKVQRMFKDTPQRLEEPVEVINAIERRKDRYPQLLDSDALNMPWRSVWFEAACDDHETKVLRESGFPRFPALTPRWQVDGNDIYGGSPGMDALGQVKGLQLRERSLAKAIEYKVEPSLQVPTSFKGRRVAMLPGGQSLVDSMNAHGGIRPAWQVDLDVQHLMLDIQRVESRIDETFFKSLFFMIANSSDTTQRTAEEIAERREEKFVMIGPGYGRIQDEALAPLVGLAFAELVEQDKMRRGTVLPPAPPELEGQPLKVEFVSVLAQALKLTGLAGQDRFLVTLGHIAQFQPEILDRFDSDAWVDSVSGVLVSPRLIRPVEKAQELREARNRMVAAERQAAQMNQTSDTVKNLASVGPAGGGLPDAMRGLTGYS